MPNYRLTTACYFCSYDDMNPFKHCSDGAVMDYWERTSTYALAAYHLRLLGFEATPEKVRRRVRAILRRNQELPLGRRPTPRDYQRIKAARIAAKMEMEIL